MSIERKLPRSKDYVFKASDGVETVVSSVEGAAMQGVLAVTPLVCGDESSMTRWTRKKGLIDPLHQHDDHESIHRRQRADDPIENRSTLHGQEWFGHALGIGP